MAAPPPESSTIAAGGLPNSDDVHTAESDDMGSLFEGMVLFTTTDVDSTNSDHDDPPPLPPKNQLTDDAPPAASEALHPADSLSQLTSLPLDEDLFSDLSLNVAAAPEQDRPPSPTTASHPQPHLLQSSSSAAARKKRRASGLRIGYGRHNNRDRAAHSPPPPPSHHHQQPPISQSLQSKSLQPTFPLAEEEEEDYHTSSATLSNEDDHLLRIHVANSPESEEEPKADLSNNTITTTSQTTELGFEEIMMRIAQKLKIAREAVTCLSAARKDFIRKRINAGQHLRQASAKYCELEKQLEEACETEDFEKADRLSESLASADKDRELRLVALRDAEAECDALDSRIQEALLTQICVEEDSASLLRSFALDASNSADLALENAEALSSKEIDEWLITTEQVELKKLQLEIESQLINEAQLTLNNSIELLMEDDHREREILYTKREILADELEKLLALVKEKEAEIAENNSNIETVEKRISGVFSNFEEVHSGLDERHNNLQLDLHQLDLEQELLLNKKKQIDDDLSGEEVRGTKIREISRISAIEASTFQDVVGLRKSLLQHIQKFSADKMKLSKTEQQLTKDVNTLKVGISAAGASLQELSSSKSSIQQEVESCKQRLFFIDKRLPELEAEKKVAATARNFKEAARIATEVKALCVEREGLGIKMGDVKSQLQLVEEQICNTFNGLEQTESQVLLREKELEMARFQRLTLIAQAATAERFAAMELGDLEEADALLAEADTAASEARKLQPLYNFRDEDLADLPKHFVPMELVSKLEGKQLAELVASVHK